MHSILKSTWKISIVTRGRGLLSVFMYVFYMFQHVLIGVRIEISWNFGRPSCIMIFRKPIVKFNWKIFKMHGNFLCNKGLFYEFYGVWNGTEWILFCFMYECIVWGFLLLFCKIRLAQHKCRLMYIHLNVRDCPLFL